MPDQKICAKLVHADFQNRIEVRILGIAGVYQIWYGHARRYIETFSDKELQKILTDCRTQRKKLGDDSQLSIFAVMVKELEQAMQERGISIDSFAKEEQDLINKILKNFK